MEISGRQFALAPHPFERNELSGRESIGQIHIRFHPRLVVNKAETGSDGVVLLGHAIDPMRPDVQNRDIARRLAGCGTSFARLESELADLGGRWLLLARFDDEMRLYPDAGGTKSVFYTDDGWVASQPGHFGCSIDQSLHRYPQAGAWPLGYTPFAGVHQLLPNHYLDLKRCRSVRFAPSGTASTGIEAAANEIGKILSGTIEALLRRGSVALPLTGGFDSRTLLSAARGYLNEIQLFSILDDQTDRHDYVLPQVLATREGKSLRFITRKDTDDVDRNTCGLYQDPNSGRIGAFGQGDYVLLGHLSEILRCFYWKDGLASNVSADLLSRLAGFGGDLADVFQGWLKSQPARSPGEILDLFYWECRAGNWASVCCTALDGFCDVISPYNSRRLLQTGLGLDPAYRRRPFELHRRLCRPEHRTVPFNETWLERMESLLPKWFPWRMRMRIRHIGRPSLVG